MKLTFEFEATRVDGAPCGKEAVADEMETNYFPDQIWVAREGGGESQYTLTAKWVPA